MPGFDRSGPMGAGPMTGGGRGVCNRTTTAGAGGQPYGRGRGFGRGFGRGLGRGLGRAWRSWGVAYDAEYAPNMQLTREQELANLKAQSGQLEQAMKEIKDRMAALENEKGSE